MPPRSKFSKRGKKSKKSFKGKRRGYKTINIVKKSLNPLPQRFITKMKYAETVTLNVGTSYAYQFNLNSIYDPNRTGIGHQPYGHDQLLALYNRYRVIGVKYSIFMATGSTGQPLMFSAVPANEVQIFSGTDEARENPRARFAIQMPGGNPVKITGYVSLPSLVGRTKAQYMADDRYQAAYGASPLELAILNIQAQIANTSALAEVSANVMLEYIVESFDIKNLGQS